MTLKYLQNLQSAQDALRANTISATELVNQFLTNIDKSQEHNHIVEVFKEDAIKYAEALDLDIKDNSNDLKPLFGCVLTIKDNICYKGHKATAGSKMLDGFTSNYSATAVDRLIKNGACIIGRTNCDEFGMGSTNENSHYGPVLNGADKTKVSGGSSGGAAVSVQLNCCHVALGSDTGGSVRQPAAFCDLIGLKPSYGRISRWGLISYASSFDQIGIIGHHIDGIAEVLSIISGPDQKDSTAINDPVPKFRSPDSDSKYKVAYLEKTLDEDLLDLPIYNGFRSLIENLSTEMELDGEELSLLDYLIPCYYILTTAEASSNLGRYDGIRFGHQSSIQTETYEEKMRLNRTEGFGLEVKRRIMAGVYVLSEGYFDVYYKKAQQVRRLIKDEVDSILRRNDILILPTTTTGPFDLGDAKLDPIKMYYSDIMTVLANLTGYPAISIPFKSQDSVKTYSIQAIALNGKESILLDFAEKMTGLAH